MKWFLKNKLLSALIFGVVFYWLYNPADRFGIVRPGLIVYNRIPVVFFDCYIDPDGKIHLEADLTQPSNITYWLDNHVSPTQKKTTSFIPLFIGTGFNDSCKLRLSTSVLQRCRSLGFSPSSHPSREAIARYEALRLQKKECAILLKVK